MSPLYFTEAFLSWRMSIGSRFSPSSIQHQMEKYCRGEFLVTKATCSELNLNLVHMEAYEECLEPSIESKSVLGPSAFHFTRIKLPVMKARCHRFQVKSPSRRWLITLVFTPTHLYNKATALVKQRLNARLTSVGVEPCQSCSFASRKLWHQKFIVLEMARLGCCLTTQEHSLKALG